MRKRRNSIQLQSDKNKWLAFETRPDYSVDQEFIVELQKGKSAKENNVETHLWNINIQSLSGVRAAYTRRPRLPVQFWKEGIDYSTLS